VIVAEAARVRLRRFTAADEPALRSWFADPELMRYIGDGTPRSAAQAARSLARMLADYDRFGFAMFAVERRADGVLMGYTGLQHLDGTATIEIGWLLDRPYQGAGYAAEAAAAALALAFTTFGIARVVAVAQCENARSRAVMERIGMRYAGVQRAYGKDLALYERTAHDTSAAPERATLAVETPSLHLAYEERGPADGVPVVLVHGFPDDPRSWDAVVAGLVADGYRTIVPYVRGFGPTRTRVGTALCGETTALARDILDLADALGLARFALVGHDWGARAAYGAAALAPERVIRLAAFAVGYGTNLAAQAVSFAQARAYWYQWFFATPRGEAALGAERRAFCADLWRTWSPAWRFTDAELERTAASWGNPEFVPIAIHSYRERWGFAPSDPRYAADRAVLAALPPIPVPTLVVMGADDGATLPESSAGKEAFFPGGYERRVMPGVGHFPQREAPASILGALRAHLAGAR
jgi:pimeloyl-ACP methyl ester carboxylesterase/RimJ/RimL family protein N-acetyltransferase